MKTYSTSPRVALWQWEFILMLRLTNTDDLRTMLEDEIQTPPLGLTDKDIQWRLDNLKHLIAKREEQT